MSHNRECFEWTGDNAPPGDGGYADAVFADRWLRTFLPRLAEVVEPLRVLMKHMNRIRHRTKRVASNRTIAEKAWTFEQVAAWSSAQGLVANTVAL